MQSFSSSSPTVFALQDAQLIIQFFANLKAFYTRMNRDASKKKAVDTTNAEEKPVNIANAEESK